MALPDPGMTVDDAPGIASALQERLRSMAQKERRYDLVAAYRAQDFFDSPLNTSYSELRKAAEKAKCWPVVREAAVYLRFMKKIYTRNHRLDDWQRLLSRLRREHQAKRRLMGVLDTLSIKKLVE